MTTHRRGTRPNVTKSRSPGKFALIPIALVLGTILAFMWYATQKVAARLGYQTQLGPPWLELGSWRIYRPWQVISWNYWYHYYAPKIFSLGMLWVASGVFASLVVLVVYIVWYARRARVATTFGTAEWGGPEELKPAGLLSRIGAVIGITDRGQYLIHDGPEHVISIAPTRSGKGRGQIVPTLLTWPHSVVVNDRKQENWDVTAGYRATFSHVLYFNVCSLFSCHYNPLLEIRPGWDQVKDAQQVTTYIVDPSGKGLTEHWDRAAYTLIFASILHVLYCEPDKTLSGVARFLSDPKRNVHECLRLMVAQKYPDAIATQVINSAAQEVLQKAEKELSGVVSTALGYLGLYRDPLIARNTADSDFRILDLMQAKYPVSLYIVVPEADKVRINPLLRLLWAQIGSRLTERLNPAENKRRLLLMVDEFPSLGRMEFFQDSLSFIAGYGIKAFLVSQSINQIDEKYGPKNSILDNCAVRVFYTPNDEVTAKRIETMLGTKTEVHQQKTFPGHRFSPLLGHVMVADQETARPLLTTGEVLTFDSDSSLVFVSGRRPIRARKLRYDQDRNFVSRLRPPPALGDGRPYPYSPPRYRTFWESLPSTNGSSTQPPAAAAGPATTPPATKPLHPPAAGPTAPQEDEALREKEAIQGKETVKEKEAAQASWAEAMKWGDRDHLEAVPEEEVPVLLTAQEEHLDLLRRVELDRAENARCAAEHGHHGRGTQQRETQLELER
jgi:type IV secretion system protein VirD4